jgi:DNA-binding HxlR family transcriptional regulator
VAHRLLQNDWKNTLVICVLASMNMANLASKTMEVEIFLKALATRHRLMILCEFDKGERSVSAIQDVIGLSQSSCLSTLRGYARTTWQQRGGNPK